MQRKVARASLVLGCALILVSGGTGGCMGELRQELAETNRRLSDAMSQISVLRSDLEKAKDELKFVSFSTDFSIRQIASRVECDNTRVRDFLKECEEGSEVCSQDGVANALKFMDTQPYVQLFLRPDVGIKNLLNTRRGQLMSLGDTHNWKPSTRFLILVQPRTDAEDHAKEALQLGRDVSGLLRTEIGVGKRIPILGPRVLPCKLKSEQLSHYSRRFDKPVKGEPRVRVFVFRTDC